MDEPEVFSSEALPPDAPKPPDAPPRRNPADNLIPYRFPPGVSGNPGGRPKNRPSPTAALLEILAEIDPRTGKPVVDRFVRRAIKSPRKMNGAIFKEVFDRIDGKIADRLDVTSKGQSLAPALGRLTSAELDALESIANKLLGGPGDAEASGPGGAGATQPD